jgi:hypothetical protein
LGGNSLPKILKILGKSVLCFIGLAAAGWALDKLDNFLMHLHMPVFFTILYSTVIGFVLWLLPGIGFAYLLFIIFMKEKQRTLILAVNGIVILIVFYVLIIISNQIQIDVDTEYLIAQLFKVGLSTIVLGFMFNSIYKTEESDEGYTGNAVLTVLLKSALCFIMMAAIFLEDVIIDTMLILSLLTPAYAFILYILVKKHRLKTVIMFTNCILLFSVWVIVFFSFTYNHYIFLFATACGNTALLTIALTFIFRNIEKRGIIETSCCKDSSIVNLPERD